MAASRYANARHPGWLPQPQPGGGMAGCQPPSATCSARYVRGGEGGGGGPPTGSLPTTLMRS
eukprot:COSAG02_NODE_345_length_24135_cov_6.425404_7_plen_62_part_00